MLRTPRRVKRNWRDFTSTVNGQTATQNRTLDETGGAGGCANEYERIDMTAGNAHSIQYFDKDGKVIHSVTVTAVDEQGHVTEVMGEGGFDIGLLISLVENACGKWVDIGVLRPKDLWHQSAVTRLLSGYRYWADLFEQMRIANALAEMRRQLREVGKELLPLFLPKPPPEPPVVAPCGPIM